MRLKKTFFIILILFLIISINPASAVQTKETLNVPEKQFKETQKEKQFLDRTGSTAKAFHIFNSLKNYNPKQIISNLKEKLGANHPLITLLDKITNEVYKILIYAGIFLALACTLIILSFIVVTGWGILAYIALKASIYIIGCIIEFKLYNSLNIFLNYFKDLKYELRLNKDSSMIEKDEAVSISQHNHTSNTNDTNLLEKEDLNQTASVNGTDTNPQPHKLNKRLEKYEEYVIHATKRIIYIACTVLILLGISYSIYLVCILINSTRIGPSGGVVRSSLIRGTNTAKTVKEIAYAVVAVAGVVYAYDHTAEHDNTEKEDKNTKLKPQFQSPNAPILTNKTLGGPTGG